MHRRSLLTVAVAAAALVACAPSIEKPAGNPASTDFVVFDPATSQIPLPNDVVRSATAIAGATGAQKELLQSFASGFPSDQALSVTIDMQRFTYGGAEPQKEPPPALDLTTLTPSTLVVADVTAPTAPVFLDVTKDVEKRFAKSPSGDRSTLIIRRAADPTTGSRRWPAGHQFAVLLRGGPSGAKLEGGGELTAMPTMYLITRDADLSQPQNQYLLPGNGRQGRAQTGVQLEALRKAHLPLFALADAAFRSPEAHRELVSAQAFTVAPSTGTAVAIDSVLPSDLLLDSTAGKVVSSPEAFCDWSATATNPATKLDANGSCKQAEAFTTLDGFSTTAMHLIGTTAPVKASTVTHDSVLLYEVGAAGFTRVPDVPDQLANPTTVVANYATQPPQVACPAGVGLPADCAPIIALQPAVPVPLSSTTTLTLPPLKEGTQYAVVVTNKVLDVTGKPLVRSAFTNLLFFQNPLADLGTGKSLVASLSDAQAVGIEKARSTLLPPLLARIQADKGITKDQVVIAYTVKTQTITGTALKLAAAPYLQAAAIVPQAPHVYANLTEVLAAYPAPPGFDVANITVANIQEIMDVPVPTLNAISNTTGALEPDNTKWTPNLVTAIVVVPNPVKVTTPCPGTSGLKCAPLVIFHHGFNDQRSDVLAMADALAGKGFVVASIDAPYHGDRTPCASTADCAVGTCVAIPGGEGQGDVAPPLPPPGLCKKPDGTPGKPLPAITGQRYFISGNLFRTRDGLRQDIIDQSSLVLALARPPTLPQVTSPLATRLAATYGLAVDPSKVYWVGQSLGAIQGTTNVAVNSRFSKAVLNVGGATTVDSLINSPTYSGRTDPTTPPAAGSLVGLLLASQKITFGTAGYLQFVNVAKWVLDPAEPLNFAKHLVAAPLPDPLSTTGAAQQQKKIFGQIAKNDQTIANPQNLELYGNIFGPIGLGTSNSVPLYTASGGGDASHGFLLDFTDNATTLAGQSDAAEFLLNDALPATATRP